MYDEAVAMVLEGTSICTIARCYKGAIIKDIGNLQRLQAEVEKDLQVNLNYIRNEEIRRNEWNIANGLMQEIEF